MRRLISIEALSHAVGVMDSDLIIRDFNQPYVDLFGFDPETLIGRSVYELAGRESNEGFFVALEASVKDGKRRVIRNDSGDFKRIFDNIISPMDGYVVVEIADVTQAVADEYAVRVLNSARDHIFSENDDLIAIVDFAGANVTLNAAFRRLFGDMSWVAGIAESGIEFMEQVTPEQLIAAGAPEFFAGTLEQAIEVWRSGDPVRASDTVPTLVGPRVIARSVTRWDFEGNPRGIAITGADLTELVETQRRAEQARHVQRFAQGVAHDFGNIAQVVGGYAQLLSLNPSPEVVAVTASSLASAASRAVALSQRIATIARIEHVANSRIDLADLLRRHLRQLRDVAGPGTVIKLDAPAAALVVGNSDQLLSAVENLCHNAARAMRSSGTIHITVEVDEAAKCVHLSVSDSGPGLPDHVRDHLFEPFVSESRANGGTGLGLYLLREYIASIGGDVDVETGPTGTTFRLTLDAA